MHNALCELKKADWLKYKNMSKKSVLLINLGTPEQCDAAFVRRYLREFLNDARVVDLPAIFRWPLVNLLIVPFRYRKTLAAYQQIWTKAGSPLLTFSEKIQEKLSQELGPDYQVELAMRYGKPTIQSALDKIRDSDSMIVIPLFPQYSSAATGSAAEKLLSCISQKWNIPELILIKDFYHHQGFIGAYAEIIKNHIRDKKIDKIIFSYHGLPERQISKSECAATCDHINDCPLVSDANQYCYRAQSYATSKLIADELKLKKNQYIVSFQSRLGRTPWIKPYTDLLLPELIQQDVKNIAVVSPSFVADCLETLEEINIRLRKQWMDLGGQEFTFIPCVNDNQVWIKALSEICCRLG